MLWFRLQQLRSLEWKVRSQAAEKLGESKDPRAVEALVKALKDKDRNVREAAAGSLGMIRDERVILPARVQLEVGINSRCLELLRRCGEFDSC